MTSYRENARDGIHFCISILDVEYGSLFSKELFLRFEYIKYTKAISIDMKRDAGKLRFDLLSRPAVNGFGWFTL